jgi:hypothetical protein
MTTDKWLMAMVVVLLIGACATALVPSVRSHLRKWWIVYAAVVLAWAVSLFKRRGVPGDELKPTDLSKQAGELDAIAAAGRKRDAQSEAKMNAVIATARAVRDASTATLVAAEEIEDTDERLKTLAALVNEKK